MLGRREQSGSAYNRNQTRPKKVSSAQDYSMAHSTPYREEWLGPTYGEGKVESSMNTADRDEHLATKPPTGDELRTIKDATDLYRSGTFKLQAS
jgi:hypothetical protein